VEPLYRILFFLLLGIVAIIVLTTKTKIHPFFALFATSFLVGIGAGLPFAEVLQAIKDGFGGILKSLGLVIILGTTLGVLLEQTGSTNIMALTMLKGLGKKRVTLATSVTGFIVGLPIFCDSGFIVLSGLNRSLARQTMVPPLTLAVALATGLYAVHCLIPPHPGVSAAAAIIDSPYGMVIATGLVVAIPATLAGYAFAMAAGKRTPPAASEEAAPEITHLEGIKKPGVITSFLPVVVPVVLIAFKSLWLVGETGRITTVIFSALGDPVIALLCGVLLALINVRGRNSRMREGLVISIEKAGGILVIIGAGGAFGAVLGATKLGTLLGEALPLKQMGIFFPFLLTVLLKTAQGSSTVAIITASTIVQPLLPALGLDDETGKLLTVLAMGAGSMMISLPNDAYFWVISKFGGLDTRSMLKGYTPATFLMGAVSMLMVYVLSRVL
jgi:GntP family gluconate:H+ symporter